VGYLGRIDLRGSLVVDRQVRNVLRARGERTAIEAAARDAGAVSVRDLAVEQLLAGATSLEELARLL
jgi:type II secretory ATPase GspE/PulE/Tfp pilus assembly ATPase PilB-like protein